MVRYLTMNGRSNTYRVYDPFALRYRRVNGTFYECIKSEWRKGGDKRGKVKAQDFL